MNLSQLKWQCRRGTQELDRLLNAYLAQHYAAADESEQQQFQRLLQLSDQQLSALFFTADSSQEKSDALIEKIRTAAYVPGA
jgi:antitoxin CptB